MMATSLLCRVSWLPRLALAGSLVTIFGCSNHPALKKLPTVPVEGKVTLDGKPVTFGHGDVSVSRVDGRNLGVDNWSVSGTIDKDGNYELFTRLGLNHGYSGLFAMKRGAPPGQYYISVRVSEPWGPNEAGRAGEPKWLIPEKYRDRRKSGLLIEVVEDAKPGAYDLHLRS